MISDDWRRVSEVPIELTTLLKKLDEQYEITTRSKIPGHSRFCLVYKVLKPRVIVIVDLMNDNTSESWIRHLLGFKDPKTTFTGSIMIKPENEIVANLIKQHLHQKLLGRSSGSYKIVVEGTLGSNAPAAS